jgi:hypothetical protein
VSWEADLSLLRHCTERTQQPGGHNASDEQHFTRKFAIILDLETSKIQI